MVPGLGEPERVVRLNGATTETITANATELLADVHDGVVDGELSTARDVANGDVEVAHRPARGPAGVVVISRAGNPLGSKHAIADASVGRAKLSVGVNHKASSPKGGAAKIGAVKTAAPDNPDHGGSTQPSEVRRFLEQVRILPFGREAAAHHAEIRWATRAQPIGPNDLVIAATTLAGDATLVTSNTGEFNRVPGLAIETWRASRS